MDGKGRVWMSSRFRRPEDQPAFCGTHPSAALAPQKSSFRQVQYFDPKARQFKQVNICFDTHHVQFAGDKDETLYGNGVFSGAIGWINTRILDETGDEAKAQGWCRGYHDLNQDGKVDPAVDRQIAVNVIYSVIPHPTDGSVWGAAPGPMPGKILRIDPKTCVGEAYEPPFDPAAGVVGYTPRGIDVDSNGVIWTALASSGHLASFDRRKCKGPLQGPSATSGQHCREGWTLHPVPGPRFKGVRGDVAVDFQVLQLRRSLQHLRSRQQHAVRERHELRFAAGVAAGRNLAGVPRAVSARILLARHGWPHRRSESRLEGPGDLRGLWTECGVAHGGRSWHSERRREVPVAARSAGEVANMSLRQLHVSCLALAAGIALGGTVLAHVELSGGWGQRFHEDLPERGAGPEIGDYVGLPMNDAARLRADSWDAGKWTMLERQCEPHPADYAPRGPASMRITSTVDPVSQDVISWHTTMMWMLPQRAIHMDGRARPSPYAQHSWQGFSTGEWEGDMLKVTTTHLKEGWLRRNGVPRSDKATLIEYFIRHGDYLTLVTIVKDPVYLTEPFVRTSNWVADAGFQLSPFSCIPTVEIERARDEVPHNLPGENRYLSEFATKHGLPTSAARGGAVTMYPDYLTQLRTVDRK